MLDLIEPVSGKTYSLFGNQMSTDLFFRRVSCITNQILAEEKITPVQFLKYLQHVNSCKRSLHKYLRRDNLFPGLSRILAILHDKFQDYTCGIEEHLKTTPGYKILTDKGLFTTREQYYLYMIEFGLVNQIHIEEFLSANFRIALLPYCLRETQTDCKAESDQLDYRCKGCMKRCYINHVSNLLRKHRIEPYIWRRAKLKPMLKDLVEEHGRTGVLGIACIVELVIGMRRCMKAHLPVVGIPLNANRCPRWMDGFYETSVDLSALENLLTPDQDLP